tara:strand:+ start:39 stop:395 length:357 start_codon:yes stop_codon:yes gene_type:complete
LASKIKNKLGGVEIYEQLGISTKFNESLSPLKTHLIGLVQNMKSESNLIIHNSRHFHALNEALKSIEQIQMDLKNNLTGDLLSIELKEAIRHIGSITGNIDNDQDILETIFSQFCIGK